MRQNVGLMADDSRTQRAAATKVTVAGDGLVPESVFAAGELFVEVATDDRHIEVKEAERLGTTPVLGLRLELKLVLFVASDVVDVVEPVTFAHQRSTQYIHHTCREPKGRSSSMRLTPCFHRVGPVGPTKDPIPHAVKLSIRLNRSTAQRRRPHAFSRPLERPRLEHGKKFVGSPARLG